MKNTIIKSERPYEKCLTHGPEYLTDSELLSVILRCGTKGVNVKELSAMILNHFSDNSSLYGLMHCSINELTKIPGVGKVKALQVICIAELAKRISVAKAEKKLDFNNPETIAKYFMESMRHLTVEQLVAVFLNSKCQMITQKVMTIGTVNKSLFSTRDIFIEALRCNCVSVIILHNHPSGDPTPSGADNESTKQIIKAGELLGIGVLDHIVIGDCKYYSYAEHNKI